MKTNPEIMLRDLLKEMDRLRAENETIKRENADLKSRQSDRSPPGDTWPKIGTYAKKRAFEPMFELLTANGGQMHEFDLIKELRKRAWKPRTTGDFWAMTEEEKWNAAIDGIHRSIGKMDEVELDSLTGIIHLVGKKKK